MTPRPKDGKGAQPEQLVEEARKLSRAMRSKAWPWGQGTRKEYRCDLSPKAARDLCDSVDALATALSECRERERELREAAQHTVYAAKHGGMPYDIPRLERALASSSTEGVAQPPSEASERSGP